MMKIKMVDTTFIEKGINCSNISIPGRGKEKLNDCIRETSKLVVMRSKHVSIDKNKIYIYANKFNSKITNWLSESPFDFSELNDEELVAFTFIFNALSFSYWGSPKWKTEYLNKQYDGTWGMLASLRKELDRSKDILYPEYLRSITDEKVREILQGSPIIPLLKERARVLREIGEKVTLMYCSGFNNIIKEANWDAPALVEIVAKNFKSFSDTSSYMGLKIHFFKRAQLFASDIHNQLLMKGKTGLANIEELTACADYKIPQVLRHEGIILYSETLSELVDNKKEIPSGSQLEIEIRAATIYAIEMLKIYLLKRGLSYTSMNINDYFWLSSQKDKPKIKPYHRTRTLAY